jgi:hypothetical protein
MNCQHFVTFLFTPPFHLVRIELGARPECTTYRADWSSFDGIVADTLMWIYIRRSTVPSIEKQVQPAASHAKSNKADRRKGGSSQCSLSYFR